MTQATPGEMGTRVRMKIETPGTRRKREEMLRGLYEENLRIADKAPARRVGRARHVRWAGRAGLGLVAVLVVFGGVQLFQEIQARQPAAPADPTVRLADEFAAAAPEPAAENLPIASLFGLEVRTIVLDAGHGGEDPGAVGPAGTREKDITLDVARRLRRRLERYDGFDVQMTREADRKLSLQQRVAFAREQRADLFVSIHVNALPDPDVTSVETYFFGLAEDPRTLQSAARENIDTELSNAEFQDALARVGRTMKFQESKQLATSIQSQLYRNMRRVDGAARDWGAKPGPFVVLLGVDVPSVLAEIAVLTNPAEEARLNDPAHREAIAEALETGILAYLGVPTPEPSEPTSQHGSQTDD